MLGPFTWETTVAAPSLDTVGCPPNIIAICDEKHAFHVDLLAGFRREEVNFDRATDDGFILLAAILYNCIFHRFLQSSLHHALRADPEGATLRRAEERGSWGYIILPQ
jgi:hypothetical protein